MVESKDLWAGLGSALGVVVCLITMALNHVRIKLFINKITALLNPYMQITIHEYEDDGVERSEFFIAVDAYLSTHCADKARKLKAELGRDRRSTQVSVADEQQIQDTLPDSGATLQWYSLSVYPRSNVIVSHPGDEKRRLYRVSFHKRFRESVLESYLPKVFSEGSDIIANNRQLRLYTNSPSHKGREVSSWSHVVFKHPATFELLAMHPTKKKAIMDDLEAFKKGKDYYAKVGKAWKRGYLLFGPPGTGKSTMIAAMANYLQYDVYDLELTAVESNSMLRRLFIETTGKSIIVVEDIDRSVNITVTSRDKDDYGARLTLSGMLNFIDGLWSACGGERIIIFTTNNKDKLDPALIRRGRMDNHIEMSYCRYEAFKVLASNYLQIEEHQFFELFGEIQQLLEEVEMSPADVAEHLLTERRDTDACLNGLVVALKKAKDIKDKAKLKEQVVEIHGETGGS
jgi:ATP-dependent 26S proteasome regulatory subunit